MSKSGVVRCLVATSIAVAVLLTEVRPVRALPNSPINVAAQTKGNTCDTMNYIPLDFGSVPFGSAPVVRRACVCGTDQGSSRVQPGVIDNTGVEFKDASFQNFMSQSGAFTIKGSGAFVNGQQINPTNDGSGCKGMLFTNLSNCPGNPAEYCYVDIQFDPSQLGTNRASVHFGVDCPSTNSGCFELGVLADYVEGSPVWLTGITSGFSIISPAKGTVQFPMSSPANNNDPGSVSITFQAQVPSADSSAAVKWMDMLQYKTSGGVSPQTLQDKFTSVGGNPVVRSGASNPPNFDYLGAGGLWTIMAMLGSGEDCVAVPVTGTPIDSCIISSKLKSLYSSGTSPLLLVQLAFSESTYAQFAVRNLKLPKSMCSGSSPGMLLSLWPTENMPNSKVKAGAKIGLMQVDTSERTAWDWVQNANAGFSNLTTQLKLAHVYQRKIQKQDTPKPPNFSPLQQEKVAVGLYKGLGKYLVPQCSLSTSLPKGKCTGGTWNWVENPSGDVGSKVDGVYMTPDPCH